MSNITIIITAVILMGALGILFGLVLAFASKKFAVVGGEKLKKLEEAMPGYNCGACGYPGCAGYAEALVNNEIKDFDLCKPGRQEVIDKITKILAKE